MAIGAIAPIFLLSLIAGLGTAAWRTVLWLRTGAFPHWPLSDFGFNSSAIKTDWVGVMRVLDWIGALDIGLAIPGAGFLLLGLAILFSEDAL